MLSGHPHIFTYIYILCNYSIYNMLSGSPPYVYICIYVYINTYIYIYYLIGSPTHIHTHTYMYIYFKPHNASTQPSQQQQPAAAAASCCYTFEEVEEMQASANVPIRDICIYI